MSRPSRIKKFGKAFPDTLARFSKKTNHFKDNPDSFSWSESLIFGGRVARKELGISFLRLFVFLFFILICFSILFLRLFHLQVAEGSQRRELADSNRIKIRSIHAPRGVIYDRNEKLLVTNEPGFRLVEEENEQGSSTNESKASSTNEQRSSTNKKISYLTRDAALAMEVSNNPRFKDLEIDSLRSYSGGEMFAHILGYVSEIDEEELKQENFKDYKIGDRIGRIGVEQTYEEILKGDDGGQVIEIDAAGKDLRVLRESIPAPGQNLILTIDKDLQEVTYKKLEETVKKSGSCCGGAVVQDVNTGEILALVSYPSFNPKSVENYLDAPGYPFINRIISGIYPPGSVFKVVSAAAGLISKKINPETAFEDTGVLRIGEFEYSNWYFNQYGRTEGMVNMAKAIKRSNDIYFYRLGQIVGETLLKDTAEKFGFGKKTEIDLPGELFGVIPDNDWKVKNMGEIWYPGDTLHMSIGQGFVLTTPIQINNMMASVANEGNLYKPRLIQKITSPEGETIKEFSSEKKNIEGLTKEELEVIKKGLEEVAINGGTAWPLFPFPIKTAGKTGTAEFGTPEQGAIGKYNTHAWYSGFAPADNPQIAVTVLVEGGGEGSSVAAPVVKEIFRWYLSNDKTNLIKDTYVVATQSAQTLGE